MSILQLLHTVAGKLLYDDLIPTRRLEDTVPSLERDDKEAFLSLLNNARMAARGAKDGSSLQKLICQQIGPGSSKIYIDPQPELNNGRHLFCRKEAIVYRFDYSPYCIQFPPKWILLLIRQQWVP
jgi:hypothetical protein